MNIRLQSYDKFSNHPNISAKNYVLHTLKGKVERDTKCQTLRELTLRSSNNYFAGWSQRVDIVVDLKRSVALVLQHLLLGKR